MPLKSIIIDRYAMPETPGYPDKITVALDDAEILYHDVCRSSPNPYRPADGATWQTAYALVAPGEYPWEYYDSPKHGPCLLLANGDPVAAVNATKENDFTASWVEIHAGQTSGWPGSAACITIPIEHWPAFIGCFAAGDKGILRIVDRMGVVA